MPQRTGHILALIGVAIVLGFGFWYVLTAQTSLTSGGDYDVCAQVITDARNPDTGEVRTFPTPCDVPDGWDTLETDREFFTRNGEEWQRYRNDDLGLRFEYRITPEGYLLVEQDELQVPSDTLIEYVSLFDRKEYAALLESTEAREGPPAISILVFENPDALTAREWIEAERILSNIQLVQGDIRTYTISGVDAIRYTTDGLYTNDTIVAENNGRIYMISGSYAQEDSSIREDFLDMLMHFSLY